MRPSGAVRTSQTPQLGSASPSIICGCCPHPRAPGALALSLDRERDLEMDTETEPKNSQTRRMTAYSIKLFTSTTPGHVKNFASRADKESAKLGASRRLLQRAAAKTTLTRLRGQIHCCGRRFSSPAESRR